MSLTAPAYVQGIAPYQAGKPISELARELGLDEKTIVKLASNENPLGMPVSAQKAMTAAIADLGRYPDSNGFELKAALAKKFSVPQDWITLGNGSNDVLELAARAFVQTGQSVVFAQHSFAVYALSAQAIGAKSIVVPAKHYGHDLNAMAAAITADTRLVFIANPNNPTGTFLPASDIEAFLKRVPANVAVVLDEAYNEYLPRELRFDSVQWLRQYPNLIISRTMSKVYGLAGLRIGFALAQAEATDMLNRLRHPFNVNTLAQVAALAALADDAFLEKSYQVNRDGLAQLQNAFKHMNLEYVPSFGNFVLVKVGDGMAVFNQLLRAGVIVRPVANYGLPQWLRVSIGLPHENERFLTVLADILKA
jgi:histidinol-phosphate aminotransferase